MPNERCHAKASISGTVPFITVSCSDFSVKDTLGSGQCFRWTLREGRMCGTAFGRYVEVAQDGENVTIYGAGTADEEVLWRRYFDLDRDYGSIRKQVIETEPRLCDAAAFAAGVHVLAQEPWEALCSFVISQNNHIPRIRGIIRRLCLHYGERADGWEYAANPEDAMTFPTAEALSKASEEQLRALGCGYRAGYLAALSRSVAEGRIDLDAIAQAATPEARKILLTIRGVGPKVAECVLLYGFGRMECFPVDVWIRRALETEFTDATALMESEYAGIAQQYIFEYIRQYPERFVKKSKP